MFAWHPTHFPQWQPRPKQTIPYRMHKHDASNKQKDLRQGDMGKSRQQAKSSACPKRRYKKVGWALVGNAGPISSRRLAARVVFVQAKPFALSLHRSHLASSCREVVSVTDLRFMVASPAILQSSNDPSLCRVLVSFHKARRVHQSQAAPASLVRRHRTSCVNYPCHQRRAFVS